MQVADYEDDGEAWPAWQKQDREAVLQPPRSTYGIRARVRGRGGHGGAQGGAPCAYPSSGERFPRRCGERFWRRSESQTLVGKPVRQQSIPLPVKLRIPGLGTACAGQSVGAQVYCSAHDGLASLR
jgi:hypothetical protein